MSTLNSKGQLLANHLARAYEHEAEAKRASIHAEKVNVVGAGGTLTAAYEQLRNAAENTEEHLLLQNAVRRFYRQLFITRDDDLMRSSGQELAVELTLAGYLANDTLTKLQIDQISALASRYYATYAEIQTWRSVSTDRASKWVLNVLAVEIESILNRHDRDMVFVELAHTQLAEMIDERSVSRSPIGDFGAALYIAVLEALLKADVATVRAALLRRYQVSIDDTKQYVEFNKQIDALIDADTTDRLRRIVDRQGAPLRILRRMMDETPNLDQLIPRRDSFLEAYEQQVNSEYERVASKLNRLIVRAVIFLIITKFLIGIAVEVPYDLITHDGIVWLPLVINLLFPPLYMIALKSTHRLPGYANTTALVDRIDAMLYGDRVMLSKSRLDGRKYGAAFSAIYTVIALGIFAAVSYGLLLLEFSLLHIVIFFVFLSAASFLGFRLSKNIRELEVVRSAQNGMTFVRDILYLPFVVIGQWMSDKYSRVNIVTIILDMLIELPLKTVLRLIRQWGAFIDDRKDRI